MKLRFMLGTMTSLALTVLQALSAHGQTVTLYDASVRAAGMGRSSNGVFWGGDPDYWGNPALLGYHAGLRYEWSDTKLVPGVADDVHYLTSRVTLGAYGVGLSLAGWPIGLLGGQSLEFGEMQATGNSGEDLGTFEPYEKVDAVGLGVSAASLLDAVLPRAGVRLPALARWGDVAVGFAYKEVEVDLAPDVPGLPAGSGQGEGSAWDRGIFLRATPYNSLDYPGELPGLDAVARCRLDVTYGGSTLNFDDPSIVFPGDDWAMPVLSRTGGAVHLAVGLPAGIERRWEAGGKGWLARSLTPMLSVGRAWQDEQVSWRWQPGRGPGPTSSDIELSGWEFSLLNVFSYRTGHIDDPVGSIHGDTDGWSLGYCHDGLVGARFDYASVPQPSDPENGAYPSDLSRYAWSVYVDPARLWRELR
jgi:hypothetical protein